MKKIFSIFAAMLFAGSMMAADVTVSKTVKELYPDADDGTKAIPLYNKDGLTITVNEKSNNGKVYDKDKADRTWRVYQSAAGEITVSLTSGVIKTVQFEFAVANGGTLNFGSTVLESKKDVTVNAASAKFVVGNSGSATNGRIDVRAFKVVYDAGGTAYCEVESTGNIKFKASAIEEETSGFVALAVVTDPNWLSEMSETDPSTDGMGLCLEFLPKQKTQTDLRGKYDVSETDYVHDMFLLEKDGTLHKYTPKSGWVAIWLNEDEDGYDLEYELVVTVGSADHTISGTVSGICHENMDINYCHVTSEGNNENMNFNAAAAGMLGSTMYIAVTTTPNILVGDWTGDGVGVTFLMGEFANRKDLRGEYTIDKSTYGAILSGYEDGEVSNATIDNGSFTISLDKNKTTYDLAYDLSLTVEGEALHFTGTIYGICDKEMDIKQALENVPAVNVKGNKVIRNGHLFIEHEGRIYDATGAQVK